MSLVSSLIPIIMGPLSLRSPILGSKRPPHPQISQLFLSIELYKYKLMPMVEGENYRGIVMLLDWPLGPSRLRA